jgi:hypothetical protein
MTDISTTLEDWFTTEGDAMTRDEHEAGADAAGERRMERMLEDEHEARQRAQGRDGRAGVGAGEGRGDDGAQCSE